VLDRLERGVSAAYLAGYGRRPLGDRRAHRGRGVVLSPGSLRPISGGKPTNRGPTTLWPTNATISAAILRRPIVGMVAGVVVMAASAAVERVTSASDVGRNGHHRHRARGGPRDRMAAQTARRAHAELEDAARLAASLEERDGCSREVHDGGFQVLALSPSRT